MVIRTCSNCGEEVEFRIFEKLSAVECPNCKRLAFISFKRWGTLWLVISLLCTIVVFIITYNATDSIIQTWGAYIPILSALFVLAILTSLRNPFVTLIMRLYKNKVQ